MHYAYLEWCRLLHSFWLDKFDSAKREFCVRMVRLSKFILFDTFTLSQEKSKNNTEKLAKFNLVIHLNKLNGLHIEDFVPFCLGFPSIPGQVKFILIWLFKEEIIIWERVASTRTHARINLQINCPIEFETISILAEQMGKTKGSGKIKSQWMSPWIRSGATLSIVHEIKVQFNLVRFTQKPRFDIPLTHLLAHSPWCSQPSNQPAHPVKSTRANQPSHRRASQANGHHSNGMGVQWPVKTSYYRRRSMIVAT